MYGGVDVTEGVGDGPVIAETFGKRVELHDGYVKIGDRYTTSKRIPLDRIDAVEFTTPVGSAGYIQFEQSSYHSLASSLSEASADENSVVFHKDATKQFEQFHDAVNDAMFGDGTSTDDEGPTDDEPEPTDASDEEDTAIQTLREEFAKGNISKAKFEERMAVLESE